MEPSDIRRRLRGAIEQARRDAAERRARTEQARRDYEVFLDRTAIPAFRQFANAAVAEGVPVGVETPAGSVRLVSDRAADSSIALTLDEGEGEAMVVGHTSTGRGRRMVTSERPLAEGRAINELTDEDVVAFLVAEIVTLINVKS